MYILFDIGGTKMRIGVSKDGKAIGSIKVVETPKNFNEGILRFKEAANELSGGVRIKAVAGGIAGLLDKDKTKLVNSPNIPGWIGRPLKKSLEKAMGASISLENDADLAGLGEAVFGAGRSKEIVVYLTISTGVGGTRIVNGKIDKFVMGFEPGQQLLCCYQDDIEYKTLEDCISGTAFEKRYKKPPYEILDKKIWDEAAKILATGLNNTIVHWSPDIIVLGGSMMKKIGIPIDRVQLHLKKILKIFPKHPVIKKAKLGDAVGLYGALAFLKQKDCK